MLSALASELAGKILVDCANPVGFDSRGAYALAVPAGSAAEQAAALLPDTTVVAAFQHLSPPYCCSTLQSTALTRTCSCLVTSGLPPT